MQRVIYGNYRVVADSDDLSKANASAAGKCSRALGSTCWSSDSVVETKHYDPEERRRRAFRVPLLLSAASRSLRDRLFFSSGAAKKIQRGSTWLRFRTTGFYICRLYDLHICHLLGLKFSIRGGKLYAKAHSVDPHLALIYFFFKKCFCLFYVEYARLNSQKPAFWLTHSNC